MTSFDQPAAPEQLPDTTSAVEDSLDRPFHTKRPHKKSRSGCKNCKARKVKCDEGRPACRSCRLRKTECVYPSPTAAPPAPTNHHATTFGVGRALPTRFAAASPSPDQTLPSPSSLPPSDSPSTSPFLFALDDQEQASSDDSDGVMVISEPVFRPTGVDATDMKLLWFYTTATAASFSVDARFGQPAEDVMKSTLVEMAFEHRFLMDSILALAGLHMRATQYDVDASRTAFYRARAIASYRMAVQDARPETYPALLSNSLILTALSSETFREPEGKDLYILDWITIWRGISLMVGLTTVHGMCQAGIEPLFRRPVLDLEAAAAAIPNNLLFMISSIKLGDPDRAHIQTYYKTLRYLGTLYMNLPIDFGPLMHLRVVTWFTFLPMGFVELARQKRPRALVIIAHYACFLKMLRKIWWVDGIGHRSLKDICNFLGPEWHSSLTVPLQALEIEDSVELGRLILNDPCWTPILPKDIFNPSTKPGEKQLGWVDDTGTAVDPSFTAVHG